MFDLSDQNSSRPTFIDLFAGAGGLSEGFIRAGYKPLAHVEADPGAAYTIRTREAFHSLKAKGDLQPYEQYLKGRIAREQLYDLALRSAKSAVINETIAASTLSEIFSRIDTLTNGRRPDLILGGPPCQAYSLVGRARSEKSMLGDHRNYLFIFYAEFLRRYRPKYFVFENVVGLLSAREENGARYFDRMLSLFQRIGYSVEYRTIAADEHGVPQIRKRVIIVGRRGKKEGFFPNLQKIPPSFCVKDVIGDLPALKPGEGTPLNSFLSNVENKWLKVTGLVSEVGGVTWHASRPHCERDLAIFEKVLSRWYDKRERLSYNDLPEILKTHKNRNSFLDRFKVVAGDLHASHTVVAHISRDGNYYIHPDRSQNRSLTPREAARLQTFPDDYFFESASGRHSRTSAFKQIGNAVPVVLSERIAARLMEVWS